MCNPVSVSQHFYVCIYSDQFFFKKIWIIQCLLWIVVLGHTLSAWPGNNEWICEWLPGTELGWSVCSATSQLRDPPGAFVFPSRNVRQAVSCLSFSCQPPHEDLWFPSPLPSLIITAAARIACSLPASKGPFLVNVLPTRDCLPHLSPLQKSPNDSGYFKGYNVVTVTGWCGISTMTPLDVPLGLFMSFGWLLLCPHLARWVPELRKFIFSVGEKSFLDLHGLPLPSVFKTSNFT